MVENERTIQEITRRRGSQQRSSRRLPRRRIVARVGWNPDGSRHWAVAPHEQRAAWVKASLPATVIREGRLLYESE